MLARRRPDKSNKNSTADLYLMMLLASGSFGGRTKAQHTPAAAAASCKKNIGSWCCLVTRSQLPR